MKREKLIIITTVLTDVIGFGIVIPILPFYVKEFGASAFTVTLMFASFSLFSFVSAPLLGALSDRIGRRPVIIASICSTSLGWIVFSTATSIPFLFLGRIIDGAAAGNFTTAQSYFVDISKDEKERTANLGLLGAAFGIGFMLGPAIGGTLSKVSHSFPFMVAGGLAAFNALMAYLFLPESHVRRERAAPMTFNPLRPILRAVSDTSLRPYYTSWLLFAMAFVTSQSVFALFLSDVFGMDALTAGTLFTLSGIVVAVNQGVLVKHLWLRCFSERTLEWMMMLILAAGMLLFSTGLLPFFYAGLVLLGTGQAVSRVVITSEVAGLADPRTKGETLGILSSIMSAAMILAPIAAGAMYEWHHTLPYLFAAANLLIGFFFAYRHRRRNGAGPLPSDPAVHATAPGTGPGRSA